MYVIRKKKSKDQFFSDSTSLQYRALMKVMNQLQSHNYTVYLAGGCVRDSILQILPKDFDIVTSATPDQVENLFTKTVSVGKNFGVIRVLIQAPEDSDSPWFEFEVASFRMDGLYIDGRRPQQVQFSSPAQDAARRDFTMNALFYDPFAEEIIDYVGGLQDIQDRRIVTVGDPESRFAEDYLRMMRAVRFHAQLDFAIEEKTLQAIVKLKSKIHKISAERILDEIQKTLLCANYLKGMKLFFSLGILAQIFFQPDSKDTSSPNIQNASIHNEDYSKVALMPPLESFFIDATQEIDSDLEKILILKMSDLNEPILSKLVPSQPELKIRFVLRWFGFFQAMQWSWSQLTRNFLPSTSAVDFEALIIDKLKPSSFLKKILKSIQHCWPWEDLRPSDYLSMGLLVKGSLSLEGFISQLIQLQQRRHKAANYAQEVEYQKPFLELVAHFHMASNRQPWIKAIDLGVQFTGSDKVALTGKELGRWLESAYLLQLSGRFSGQQDLLAELKKQFFQGISRYPSTC